MKKSTWTDTVTCPNEECEGDIEVSFYPGHKGRTYGPPEDCFPPDPDEIDAPEECPHCGQKITDKDLDRWCEELSEERSNRDDRY